MCPAQPLAQFTDLPQEIRNHIVELLHGHNDDLANCALAHRSLTWAAQKELHHTVHFDWALGESRDFIELISRDLYANLTIASFVRHLKLTWLPTFLCDDHEVEWTILARLINVEHLEICPRNYNNSWHWGFPEDREFLRSAFPNVTTLEISGNHFSYAEDFLFFLSAFPQVTRLRMDDVSFHDDEFPRQPVKSVPCPKLRTLEVSFRLGPDVLEIDRLIEKWLEPLCRISEPVLMLKWHDTSYHEDAATWVFSRVVKALSPVLRSLEVELANNAPDVDLEEDPYIDQCTTLESLSFMGLCYDSRWSSDREFNPQSNMWALDLLSQVTSPRLKKITFDFSASKEKHLDSLDFGRLIEVLLESRFAEATIVLSVVEPMTSPESMTVFTKLVTPFVGLWQAGRVEIRSRDGGPSVLLTFLEDLLRARA